MSSINWLAILVAAISAFVVGGIWYSPIMFSNAWMKENKLIRRDCKGREIKQKYLAGPLS